MSLESTEEEKLAELLQEAYYDELESAMNYLSNGLSLEGVRGEVVGEHMIAEYQDEVGHAKRIAEHLDYRFDVVVDDAHNFEASQDFLQSDGEYHSDDDHIVSVIEGVMEAERDAIETYQEIADLAVEHGFHSTRKLAEELLDDEHHHLDEFESLREEYR